LVERNITRCRAYRKSIDLQTIRSMKGVKMNSRIFFGILIIAVIGGLWIWEDQAYADSTEATFPQGLIVASQNGLVGLVYDPSKQTYQKQAEIALSDTIKGGRVYPEQIVAFDNYIFVRLGNKILRFNRKLEKSISKKCGKIGALATDGKSILVAAERSLIILNENLEELDRVGFEFGEVYKYAEKDVHDILIHENTAYLLDDVVTPLFLFRVNIKDPKHIRVTERIEFDDVNAHLDRQWLNVELGQWIVIQSYCSQMGSGQVVHIYSMRGGKKELAKEEVYCFQGMPRGIPGEKGVGIEIIGITDLPPILAIVRDAEEKYHLSQINSENNKISFSSVIDLDDFRTFREVIIKRKDNYLFVAPMGGTLLRIIDVGRQPKIVFSEDLRQYNIREVADILPY
jgi:hypothetical protein